MPEILSVVAALGPVFALVVLGQVLGRWPFPDPGFWPQAERLTYYLLFPALLVLKLAEADLPGQSLPVVALALVLLLGLASGLMLLGARLAGLAPEAATSVFQGGVRFNTYVGLASAGALYGEPGLVWGAVFIGIMIPLVNLACVLCFALLLPQRSRRSLGGTLRTLARNPLIVACLLGGTLNLLGTGLPSPLVPVLELLGAMALPLGLLAVGVALDLRVLARGGTALWLSCGFKLLGYPLLFLLIAQLLGLPEGAQKVILLFALLPTAPSAFILARQMGGDAALMAAIITLQTLLAMLSMPVVLAAGAALY